VRIGDRSKKKAGSILGEGSLPACPIIVGRAKNGLQTSWVPVAGSFV
jgi:hypothetical protein